MSRNAEIVGGGALESKFEISNSRRVPGDIPITAIRIPAPKPRPVIRAEVVSRKIRPGDEMPPIVRRQINSVGLMVCDDYAATVQYAVFAEILLIDAQHIR
jgi:hypothetical protein